MFTQRFSTRYWSLFIGLSLSSLLPWAQAAEAPAADSETLDTNDYGEVITLPEFQIKSSSLEGTYIAEKTTAMRTGDEIINIPFNVHVFNEEIINDFALYTDDALLAFAGGSAAGSAPSEYITLRGFQKTTAYDGFTFGLSPVRMNNRGAELIKGPMSTMYGRTTPGGILNKTSRRPKTTREGNFTTSIDSAGSYFAGISSTGAIAPSALDKKLYYFAYYQYEHIKGSGTVSSPGAYDVDFIDKDSHAFGLSLLYMFKRSTSLTLTFSIQPEEDSEIVNVSGWKTVNSDTSTLTRGWREIGDFSIVGPDGYRDYLFWGFNALFEHRINANWSIRSSAQGFSKDTEKSRWSGANIYIVNDGTFNARRPYEQDYEEISYGFQADLVGKFSTGKIGHRVILGVDSIYQKTDNNERTVANDNTIDSRAYRMSFTNPFYGSFESDDLNKQTSYYSIYQQTYGALASYTASLLDGKLLALASVRYDFHEDKFKDRLPKNNSSPGIPSPGDVYLPDGVTTKKRDSSPTYSLGLTYKLLDDNLVLYANTSTGYLPQKGAAAVDKGMKSLVAPYESTGFEAGVKGATKDKRFVYSATLFWIKQENVKRENDLYVDSIYNGQGDVPQFLTGSDKALGIEASAYFRPTKQLLFKLELGYIKSEIVSNDKQPWSEGRPVPYVGKWSGAFIGKYEFTKGSLKGLSFATTASFSDKYTAQYMQMDRTRVNVTALQQDMPSLFLMKFVAGYSFKTGKKTKHELRILVQNLLDREFYQTSGRPARGREYMFTYNLTF